MRIWSPHVNIAILNNAGVAPRSMKQLLPLAALASLLFGVQPGAAQGAPNGFTWHVPDRFGILRPDTVVEYHWNLYNEDYDPGWVNPSKFPVVFDACNRPQEASGFSQTRHFRWLFGDAATRPDSEGSISSNACRVTFEFEKNNKTYTASLEIYAGASTTKFVQNIAVRDLLIVQIGDSYASGEGAPDKPRGNKAQPTWVDHRCHRSAKTGAAQAAIALERIDKHTSVTFLSYACSGATIDTDIFVDGKHEGKGLLAPYLGMEGPNFIYQQKTFVPAQVSMLPNKRPIDALIIGAGVNDLHFSKIIAACVTFIDSCYNETDLNKQLKDDLTALPVKYGRLASELKSRTIKHVFLTEYPDAGKDDSRQTCDPMLNDILWPGWRMSKQDAQWAYDNVLVPLNRILAQAAAAHNNTAGTRWHFVNGISEVFQGSQDGRGHGYCASDNWIMTATESGRIQGPDPDNVARLAALAGIAAVGVTGPGSIAAGAAIARGYVAHTLSKTTGLMHPNEVGHRVVRDRMTEALARELFGAFIKCKEAFGTGIVTGGIECRPPQDPLAKNCTQFANEFERQACGAQALGTMAAATEMPFAELLAATQGSNNADIHSTPAGHSRVVLDVHYRINPSVIRNSVPIAKLRVCLGDPDVWHHGEFDYQVKVDSLFSLEKTPPEGKHVFVGFTWTDKTKTPPARVMVRAEIVPESAALTSECTRGQHGPPATKTFDPDALVWTGRNFRTPLNWLGGSNGPLEVADKDTVVGAESFTPKPSPTQTAPTRKKEKDNTTGALIAASEIAVVKVPSDPTPVSESTIPPVDASTVDMGGKTPKSSPPPPMTKGSNKRDKSSIVVPLEKIVPAKASVAVKFAPIAVGDDHACALGQDGTAYCWGRRYGEEARSIEAEQPFVAMGSGGMEDCGITASGALYCWTHNQPASLKSDDLRFISMTSGNNFSCGIAVDQVAYCWGIGEWGQLGNGRAGTEMTSQTPVLVSGGARWSSITADTHESRTCGVTTAGTGYCWGSVVKWDKGPDAEHERSLVPVRVPGAHTYKKIAFGQGKICGLATNGTVYCWGYRSEVEDTVKEERVATGPATPRKVDDIPPLASFGAGHFFMCGLTPGGAAYCWPANDDESEEFPDNRPARVGAGLTFKALSVGELHACGMTASGAVHCWGGEEEGERLKPLRVDLGK